MGRRVVDEIVPMLPKRLHMAICAAWNLPYHGAFMIQRRVIQRTPQKGKS